MDKHGNWMHIALVENTEDYIHHEHCCDDQKRQRPKELLEDQTLHLVARLLTDGGNTSAADFWM